MEVNLSTTDLRIEALISLPSILEGFVIGNKLYILQRPWLNGRKPTLDLVLARRAEVKASLALVPDAVAKAEADLKLLPKRESDFVEVPSVS